MTAYVDEMPPPLSMLIVPMLLKYEGSLYNSFRRVDVVSSPSAGVTAGSGGNSTNSSTGNRRGSGGVENIGDITAKGEAQIAIVDLLGIVSGICLSSE
jgi:hypothetical protein